MAHKQMKYKLPALLALLGALCGTVLPMAAQTPVTGVLPLDETVRIGHLENGMTYYIKHAENPPQRADFFIAHNVGALQEEDDQNGLAHFLEHMAFNGTKHFPKKGILNYLSSIGLRFGANVNAYTARERTVYNITNVPLLREGILDSALLILHDWSAYISCEPEEVEFERGVIREEWRRRDIPRMRMMRKTDEIEFAGSKYALRDVIGDPHIISTFDRQTLVDYYHKWYRPDMQAVIVVGDVDVDAVEAKIRQVMSDIPRAVAPTPKETYTLPETVAPRYGVIVDAESQVVAVKLVYRQPYPSPEERPTRENLHQTLARKIFLEIVRARLERAEKREDAHYKRVVAVLGRLATCKNTFQLTALPNDQDLRDAFIGMLLDVEQIRRYPFSRKEFEHAKAKVAHAEEAAGEKLAEATNGDLAGLYVEHFTCNEPYMTAETRKAETRKALDAIDLETINRLRDGMIDPKTLLMLFTAGEKYADRVPSESEARALLDSVLRADVPAPEQLSETERPLFDKDPVPGHVVTSEPAPCDAVLWTLDNGAKVMWRTVPEVSGKRKIGMMAVNRGAFSRDADVEALRFLQAYVRTMGVKGMSHNQLSERFFDRELSVSASLGRQYATVSGSCDTANWETMLQLVNLYLTEPDFSAESYDDFIRLYRTTLEKADSPKQRYREQSDSVLYGQHPWLQQVSLQTLDRMDAAQAQACYRKLFGNAADYIFYFAGELSPEEARPMIERYIGSLPAWPRQEFTETQMPMRPGILDFEYHHEGRVTPRSEVERIYHAPFDCTPDNYAALRYISHILGARYMATVREEKGGTYHIDVQHEAEVHPQGTCWLRIQFETNPAMCHALLEEVQKGIEALAAAPPSEQEVDAAKRYFQKVHAEQWEKRRKSTAYWLHKMDSHYTDGVDFETDDEAVIASVTPAEIQELTAHILAAGNRFTSVYTQGQEEKQER